MKMEAEENDEKKEKHQFQIVEHLKATKKCQKKLTCKTVPEKKSLHTGDGFDGRHNGVDDGKYCADKGKYHSD